MRIQIQYVTVNLCISSIFGKTAEMPDIFLCRTQLCILTNSPFWCLQHHKKVNKFGKMAVRGHPFVRYTMVRPCRKAN